MVLKNPSGYGANLPASDLIFIGLLFAAASVLTALGMLFGGELTDKIGPRRIMVIGGLVAGVIALAFPFVTAPITILARWIILGVGIFNASSFCDRQRRT